MLLRGCERGGIKRRPAGQPAPAIGAGMADDVDLHDAGFDRKPEVFTEQFLQCGRNGVYAFALVLQPRLPVRAAADQASGIGPG